MDTPAQALDKELKVALHRFQRMRWMMVGVAGFAVAIAITVGAVMLVRQSHQLRSDSDQISRNEEQIADDGERLLASCDFYRSAAPSPVSVDPGTGKAYKLSVSVIIGAREAYLGEGCAGRIPPPDPSLLRWAAYFRIPVRV